MRTLLKVTPEVTSGNKAIANGTLPEVIKATMDQLQPEAAYFYTDRGERTCIMIFDLKDPSEIPVIAEPFFTKLNARVEFTPVMDAEDLQKGLQKVGQSEVVLEQ